MGVNTNEFVAEEGSELLKVYLFSIELLFSFFKN